MAKSFLCLLLLLLNAAGVFAAAKKPRIDPAEIPFRRAPMAESARSVVLSLSSNVHSAFDAELLRTHTVWTGGPLRIWGPPHHGSSDRFICDFEGKVLLKTGPFSAWWNAAGKAITNLNFTGIKTDGNTRLLYRVEDAYIVEEQTFEGSNFVRTLHLTGNKLGLNWLAFTSLKTNLPSLKVIGGTLRPQTLTVDYPEILHTEKNGKGPDNDYKTNFVRGTETRLFVEIKPGIQKVRLEILMPELEPGINRPSASEPAIVKNQPKPIPNPDSFYKIEQYELPAELELLITGMDWLKKDVMAVSTWPGEVYFIDLGKPHLHFQRFATGLNEPVGLKVHGGKIYVTQKQELTRLDDTNHDGKTDFYENINDDWGFNGNYHAFAMGPVIDAEGNFYVYINGHRTVFEVPYMGWAVKIDRTTRALEGFCSGFRSPNGYAIINGDLFMADNQGNWTGACKLNHLQKGRHYGHPSSWPAPPEQMNGAANFSPPAVWFPYSLAKSASGIAHITNSNFGPFNNQLLVADFQNSLLTRVSLEKINGEWQGTVWPFVKGFGSGVNRMIFDQEGKLYVGGGKRAHWGSALGPKEASLDRVTFTGKVPFEVKHVSATPTGFELEFTKELDVENASDPDGYSINQYRYEYWSKYGSPEHDHEGRPNSFTPIPVKRVEVKGKKVRLDLAGLKSGYVTAFTLGGFVSAEGEPLWHETFHYTLNNIPK